MKVYEGRRESSGAVVTRDGEPLDPRLDLRRHSIKFEWGYGGSGPAQLALAILTDHLEDDGLAEDLYQRFKWAVVSNLPASRWRLTSEEIDKVLDGLRAVA